MRVAMATIRATQDFDGAYPQIMFENVARAEPVE